MIIIFSFIILFILLFLYCAIKVSSDCSREEEQREMLWQQQEYGKYQKD